jgi:hypothetical protein
MKAEVTTYGGNRAEDGYCTVQHWQLYVDGEFIADTSNSAQADLFHKIAQIVSHGGEEDAKDS